MRRIAVASLSGTLAITIACATSHRTVPRDTEDVAITSAMQHYAALIKSGPSDSVASMYAPAGELVLPGMEPLHGPVAIRAFLEPLAAMATVERVQVTSDSVRVTGQDATQAGTFVQLVRPRGATTSMRAAGTYDARWHREPDGAWRLTRLAMHPVTP